MKLIFIFPFLILFAACNNSENPKTTQKRPTIQEQKDTIIQLFEQWKIDQVKAGNWVSEENCNPDWMQKQYDRPDFESSKIPTIGFQTEMEGYGYSFGDLNQDGKLDGMVSFQPKQCDGGNGSMWAITDVFILSDMDSYRITDTIDFSEFDNTAFDSSGFYQFHSISGTKVYGTFIQFLEDDGHCCPSINREVIFDFPSRKLIYLGDYFKLSKKHKPNTIYCDMDGDKRKDTVKIVQNTANEKYGLAFEFGNGKSKYLGMGVPVLDQEFDDLEWVGKFKKVKKGEVVWNNVIGGEIVSEDQISEEDKIILPNDAILIHQLESCGGGIIYWKNGTLFWVQQE